MTISISPTDLPAELFWSLAALGAGLFIAYSVALVGIGPQIGDPERQNWLSSSCALGVLSASAIAISLGLGAFVEAQNSAWIEILGLCWIAANLVLLAIFIALLPAIAASWRDTP